MRTIFAFLLGFLLAPAVFAQCGEERIQVKTTADVNASKIDYTPVDATVAELNALPVPRGLEKNTETRFPEELKVYKVDAFLGGFKIELGDKKSPGDRDFHIVIADLKTPDTMIVEMVHPDCVPKPFELLSATLRDTWSKRFGVPTKTFRDVSKHKMKIEVTGIGFYDIKHNNDRDCNPGEKPTKKDKHGKMVCQGQDGHAKNNFELHRVISWKEIQ